MVRTIGSDPVDVGSNPARAAISNHENQFPCDATVSIPDFESGHPRSNRGEEAILKPSFDEKAALTIQEKPVGL